VVMEPPLKYVGSASTRVVLVFPSRVKVSIQNVADPDTAMLLLFLRNS